MKRTPSDRFWAKVNKNGPVPEQRPDLGPCWLWTATTAGAGYGWFWDGTKPAYAHRWAFEDENGPIPETKEPDHLCCIRLCVNPAHMELVTHAENLRRGQTASTLNARKTHCPRGHPYDLTTSQGARWCSICRRASEEQRRQGRPARGQATSCPRGHPYVEANLYWHGGKRYCRACRHEYAVRRWQQRQSTNP